MELKDVFKQENLRLTNNVLSWGRKRIFQKNIPTLDRSLKTVFAGCFCLPAAYALDVTRNLLIHATTKPKEPKL